MFIDMSLRILHVKRIVKRNKYEDYKKAFETFAKNNGNFEAELDVLDSNHHVVKLHLSMTCVSGQSNNIAYILRTINN